MAVGSLSTPSPGVPEVGGDAGRRTLTTFARSMSAHADVVQPADDASWAQLLARASGRGITVRGAGASYSDAPLNSGGTVARTGGGGAAVRSWNEAAALVEVDAGMSLAELCAHTVPRGLLPPVLPGTAHVTVGASVMTRAGRKTHDRNNAKGTTVARAVAATSAPTSTTHGAPGAPAFSNPSAPSVRARPTTNTSSPCSWARPAPARPRTPKVSRRLAAVLPTAVRSSAPRLAACAGLVPRR